MLSKTFQMGVDNDVISQWMNRLQTTKPFLFLSKSDPGALCACFVTGWLTYVQFGTLELSFLLQAGRVPLVSQEGGWMRQRRWVGWGGLGPVHAAQRRGLGEILASPLLFDEPRFFGFLSPIKGHLLPSSGSWLATEPDLQAPLCKETALGSFHSFFPAMQSVALDLSLSNCPPELKNWETAWWSVAPCPTPQAWPPQPRRILSDSLSIWGAVWRTPPLGGALGPGRWTTVHGPVSNPRPHHWSRPCVHVCIVPFSTRIACCPRLLFESQAGGWQGRKRVKWRLQFSRSRHWWQITS